MYLNNKGGTKVDTLIKLVLIFFISLFSFAVGTFLGKKFSDKQHRIAQIEREYGKSNSERGVASISPHSTEVQASNALSEADINSISEEFSQAETDEMKKVIAEAEAEIAEHHADPHAAPSADAHAAAPHASAKAAPVANAHAATHKPTANTHDAHADHAEKPQAHIAKAANVPANRKLANSHDPVANVAHAVAQGHDPLPPEKKVVSRIPNTLPPKMAHTNAQFTVQVASYQNEAEASAHAEKLVQKGKKAFHYKAVVNNQTWYRVGIGAYVSQTDAAASLRDMKDNQEINSGFVSKIVQ